MSFKNKSSVNENNNATLIYKNKLLRIEEIHFYPGNLRINFKNRDDKVIHSFMDYIIEILKTVVTFEESYLIVTKDANKTGVSLYPWTEALVDRFRHPSRYVYPFKTEFFTEKLREVFQGKFKEEHCEKFVNKTEASWKTLLTDEQLRALENMEETKAIKAKGFTIDDILKNVMTPITSAHYFISNKRKKTGQETFKDIMEIFSLLTEIKSQSAEKIKKNKNVHLSIVK